jgi:hypothetical protein
VFFLLIFQYLSGYSEKRNNKTLGEVIHFLPGFENISGPENENVYFMSTSSVRLTELEDRTPYCPVE